MSRYRRCLTPGATYFFTLTLENRTSSLLVEEIDRFRSTYRRVLTKRPVDTVAISVMPDHLHAIWTMPEDDADYSTRWNLIKATFSRGIEKTFESSRSQERRRESGIWQRRFWEHRIQTMRIFESTLTMCTSIR